MLKMHSLCYETKLKVDQNKAENVAKLENPLFMLETNNFEVQNRIIFRLKKNNFT